MKIIFVLFLMVISFSLRAQEEKMEPLSPSKEVVGNWKEHESPLYIVNGTKKEVVHEIKVNQKSIEEILNLSSNDIESISVLKGQEAINKYGDEGKFGVVLITTKTTNKTTPLYLVDGAEVKSIEGLDPDNIESITVWKDKEHTREYGDAGKDGVIVVTTRNLKKRE